jgi:3-keto-5-aminohexanoate cleavage enzyme
MSKFRLKERKAPLPHPRPEMLIDECIPFSYKVVSQFATEMQKRGIKPELETYHTGGAWVARDLIANNLIDAPYWIQTVMGAQTASFPTVDNLLHLVRELPAGTLWLCSAIGPYQLPLTTVATLMGGHIRVGLEDNVYYRRGERANGNAQLVERAARLVNELNREVATPQQARAMLGIRAEPTQYT